MALLPAEQHVTTPGAVLSRKQVDTQNSKQARMRRHLQQTHLCHVMAFLAPALAKGPPAFVLPVQAADGQHRIAMRQRCAGDVGLLRQACMSPGRATWYQAVVCAIDQQQLCCRAGMPGAVRLAACCACNACNDSSTCIAHNRATVGAPAQLVAQPGCGLKKSVALWPHPCNTSSVPLMGLMPGF